MNSLSEEQKEYLTNNWTEIVERCPKRKWVVAAQMIEKAFRESYTNVQVRNGMIAYWKQLQQKGADTPLDWAERVLAAHVMSQSEQSGRNQPPPLPEPRSPSSESSSESDNGVAETVPNRDLSELERESPKEQPAKDAIPEEEEGEEEAEELCDLTVNPLKVYKLKITEDMTPNEVKDAIALIRPDLKDKLGWIVTSSCGGGAFLDLTEEMLKEEFKLEYGIRHSIMKIVHKYSYSSNAKQDLRSAPTKRESYPGAQAAFSPNRLKAPAFQEFQTKIAKRQKEKEAEADRTHKLKKKKGSSLPAVVEIFEGGSKQYLVRRLGEGKEEAKWEAAGQIKKQFEELVYDYEQKKLRNNLGTFSTSSAKKNSVTPLSPTKFSIALSKK